jgi:hypothetical protein
MKTIQQELQKWLKINQNMERATKNKKRFKKKKSPKEKLSDRDLKELMGINRPVYRRAKGGAFRQK